MAQADHDQVIASLQQLGLSLYEARLYLGLLTGGPQNGNELSRTSGVPSSKVYAMVERLAAEGIAVRTARGTNVEYVCVPPHDLLHKLRERYTKPLDFLDEVLPTIGLDGPEPEILQVEGLNAIFDHARAIIRASSQELVLSVWEENVAPLRASASTSFLVQSQISTSKPASAIRRTRSRNGRSTKTISADTARR